MIVGLVGEAVVIAEDIRPLIPRLFLSPDNTSTVGGSCHEHFEYLICARASVYSTVYSSSNSFKSCSPEMH